ncbi:hypothetical protein QEJ31_08240 [Pigmentibacter sp. JX0631]|uniref:hypothetical protein n=1 Tax=Pigmentibacter sp. JX0631 TaxID=2976982 RepID=UPI00246997F4|nr:hypothetical protein [Pigmentibacter sp. JX0631]WGL58528.1 hypothetical protein QEJ31_08240 [Pigmentibacter sp. JX0631]
MKQKNNYLKYLLYFITVLIISIFGICSYFFLNMKAETPALSEIAQKIGQPTFAFAFNYTTETDKQLYLFSKNIGLENNPRTQQNSPPTGELGAKGFFVFNMFPANSDKAIIALDNILKDFLTSSETIDDNEFFDPEPMGNEIKDTYLSQDSNIIANNEELVTEIEDNPFSKPLTHLIEELWNGNTLLIGGVTQLHLSLKDSFLISLDPLIKKVVNLSSDSLKNIVINNIPISIQNFLSNHAIELSSESLDFDESTKINHSQLIFSISDPLEFLNSICSQKNNPWDFCGRFNFQRNGFRKNLESFLALLSDDFKIKLDIYWTITGHSIIYSNQKQFIIDSLNPNKKIESKNILTSVSSSGADFLLPTDSSKKYSSISFLSDMIQSQNKLLDLIERVRKKSSVLSDYFSSPNGEINFRSIEKTINNITSYSESASLTLDTDGDKLIPKIRLYSPVGDLFTKQGKELNPEVLNTIKIFITKTISFGNFLLPRGLVPLPGPYLSRNGKWVIIQSEIPVKSIAPYLESIDPYVDSSEDSTKL